MSFISILKKVGSVAIGIEHVAAPMLEAAVPGLAPVVATMDGVFQHLQNSIVSAEANNPVDAQGALKSAAVVADFQALVDTAQSMAQLKGEQLTYDPAALQKAINDNVTAFNSDAALKASFKLVPILKAQ